MGRTHSFDPRRLSQKERSYYRDFWGFDPIADKRTRSFLHYYYESNIPLENDLELQGAGVSVYVRVKVEIDGTIHNRIVFSRGDKLAEFECVHTIVYAAPAKEILDLPPEQLAFLGGSTEGHEAILPPWEHFVALKSYVAGIAAVGFLKAIIPESTYEGDYLGFDLLGKESSIFDQLKKVLFHVAPDAFRARSMKDLGVLIEQRPIQWLVEHWGAIVTNYKAHEVLANVAFWDVLPPMIQEKVHEVLRRQDKPVRARHPNSFDSELDVLALPNVNYIPTSRYMPSDHRPDFDVYFGRKFFGMVSYDKIFDVQNRSKEYFGFPQLLVRTFFTPVRVEEGIEYCEDPNEDRKIGIISAEYLCPTGASHGQKFARMCDLAKKIAAMNGEILHKAAAECCEKIPPKHHIDSITFLNTLAEYDLVAARAIANFIFPSEISKYFLETLNFIH